MLCQPTQDRKIGTVIWDTGIASDWQESWPEQFRRSYTIRRLNGLGEKLAELGVSPEKVDLLICSHLHYDHAGNIKLFRNTKAGKSILISEAEAREAFVKAAMSPDGVSGAYFRDEFIMDGIGYQTIQKEMWLSDDIFLFIQEGHTPGVVGMLVKTENNGNFIFPSDAVYSQLNYGPPVVLPGLCIAPESYRKNIEYLRIMQEKFDAKIVFSHDAEEFMKWKHAPYFYE